jgi:hypothetical protein
MCIRCARLEVFGLGPYFHEYRLDKLQNDCPLCIFLGPFTQTKIILK